MGLQRDILNLLAWTAGWFSAADLSIFHEFEPPPTGGGHQFLRTICKQAEMRGFHVENNRISRTSSACLFNSFNFDEGRLRLTRRDSVLYVHRVDGPIDIYRGRDDGMDKDIFVLNKKFAEKTIFQSYYSLQKHLELGMEFRNPVVIMNAADPEIFHSGGRAEFSLNRKIRLIASSWSDNPNKGAFVYQWMDENLDWSRFEMTFVGRSPLVFRNIRMLPAVDSYHLAELLREHDIYITASKNDPCSNSLIEALSCGLPVLYLQSGGHPEIVKQAGAGFEAAEQIPALLEKMVDNYKVYQSQIYAPSIQDIGNEYLKVLELM
jgi:glycosyltransferase involved in cell wall biosynthesis